MTHEPAANMIARAELTKIYTWYAEMFGKFLGKLDAMPEGKAAMLDNCSWCRQRAR
jgi:hypothetical protein